MSRREGKARRKTKTRWMQGKEEEYGNGIHEATAQVRAFTVKS